MLSRYCGIVRPNSLATSIHQLKVSLEKNDKFIDIAKSNLKILKPMSSSTRMYITFPENCSAVITTLVHIPNHTCSTDKVNSGAY